MLVLVIALVLIILGLIYSAVASDIDATQEDHKPPNNGVSNIKDGKEGKNGKEEKGELPQTPNKVEDEIFIKDTKLANFVGLSRGWYTDEFNDFYYLYLDMGCFDLHRRIYRNQNSIIIPTKLLKFDKENFTERTVCQFRTIRADQNNWAYHLISTDKVKVGSIKNYLDTPIGTLKEIMGTPQSICWKEILKKKLADESKYVKDCEDFVDKVKIRYEEYKDICGEFGRDYKEPITDINVFLEVVTIVGLNEEYHFLFLLNSSVDIRTTLEEILNRK